MIDTGSQPVIFKLLRFLWNLLYQWHCCSPNTHFSVSTNGRAGFPPTDQSQVRIGSYSFITVLIHTVAIGGSEDNSKASLIYYVLFNLYLNTADVKRIHQKQSRIVYLIQFHLFKQTYHHNFYFYPCFYVVSANLVPIVHLTTCQAFGQKIVLE